MIEKVTDKERPLQDEFEKYQRAARDAETLLKHAHEQERAGLAAEIDRLRAEFETRIKQCVDLAREKGEAVREIERLKRELVREEASHGHTVDVRDHFEEALTTAAALLGCENEWTSLHDHARCVPELADRLRERLAEAERLLARIRDDYGDVWGGCRDVKPQGPRLMVCVCCDEEAADYPAIIHDVDCPVAIAAGYFAAAPPSEPTPPKCTCITTRPGGFIVARQSPTCQQHFPVQSTPAPDPWTASGRHLGTESPSNPAATAFQKLVDKVGPLPQTQLATAAPPDPPKEAELTTCSVHGESHHCDCAQCCPGGQGQSPTPLDEMRERLEREEKHSEESEGEISRLMNCLAGARGLIGEARFFSGKSDDWCRRAEKWIASEANGWPMEQLADGIAVIRMSRQLGELEIRFNKTEGEVDELKLRMESFEEGDDIAPPVETPEKHRFRKGPEGLCYFTRETTPSGMRWACNQPPLSPLHPQQCPRCGEFGTRDGQFGPAAAWLCQKCKTTFADADVVGAALDKRSTPLCEMYCRPGLRCATCMAPASVGCVVVCSGCERNFADHKDNECPRGAFSAVQRNLEQGPAASPPACVKCGGTKIDRQGRVCRYCSWKPEAASPPPALPRRHTKGESSR